MRLIRTYRPEVIATWNPSERFENYQIGYEHSDHRAAGAVTLQWYVEMKNEPVQNFINFILETQYYHALQHEKLVFNSTSI